MATLLVFPRDFRRRPASPRLADLAAGSNVTLYSAVASNGIVRRWVLHGAVLMLCVGAVLVGAL
jgi:hypothetical protein